MELYTQQAGQVSSTQAFSFQRIRQGEECCGGCEEGQGQAKLKPGRACRRCRGHAHAPTSESQLWATWAYEAVLEEARSDATFSYAARSGSLSFTSTCQYQGHMSGSWLALAQHDNRELIVTASVKYFANLQFIIAS